MIDLKKITDTTDNYNFHAHTQFCDGRDSMSDIAAAAAEEGLEWFGFSPHSPVPIESPCNMGKKDVAAFVEECDRLDGLHSSGNARSNGSGMRILKSMEIDFLGADWGPHVDYFQCLPLDYRIGSVHFVPNQDGVHLDCDGRFERFSHYLKEGYRGDLRYVVEKYFEQVLTMLERGGFDILGHFDKIAGNASQADSEIENQGWYEALVDDVVSHAVAAGVLVEINTKAYADKGRFYPHPRWWEKLRHARLTLVVDSDAHYASKVISGRSEALSLLRQL